MHPFDLRTRLAVVGLLLLCAPRLSYGQEDVTFRNGEVRLAGTLHHPGGDEPAPAVVVLHSANGGLRGYPEYDHLKERLPDLEIAVLTFDRRGHGASTGNFQTAEFDDLADDGLAALDYLADRSDIDPDRIGFWGVSQGGWIGPVAATRSDDVAFVITVSGPGVSPAEQMIYSARRSLEIAGYPGEIQQEAAALRRRVDEYFRGRIDRQTVQAAIESVRAEPWFQFAYIPGGGTLPTDIPSSKWAQEMDYDPIPVLRRVDVPLLVLFGSTDRWVPVDESIERMRTATSDHEDITIVNIEGADHYLRVPADARSGDSALMHSDQYIRVLDRWLMNRLSL